MNTTVAEPRGNKPTTTPYHDIFVKPNNLILSPYHATNEPQYVY
jgi:hypothetical protein